MPDWIKEVREAIARLNLDLPREAEVVEELSQHLQERYEDMVAKGISEQQAHEALFAELHDGRLVAGLKATIHGEHPLLPVGKDGRERWIAGVWKDLSYGARLLRLNPGFALVAIVSLALGIGANTTIFQLLDAVRLRTLPVKAPEQLATVRIANHPNGRAGMFVTSHPDLTSGIWDMARAQQQGFSGIAAWAVVRKDLGRGGEAHFTDALMVSGSFFDVLGVQPVLGRLISSADDYRGCGAQGAVLSYSFWQKEYGGRADVIGRKLTLDGHPFEITGVTPASFYGLEIGRRVDLAIALCSEPVFADKDSWTDSRDVWWLSVIGRLKPGWTPERASAQLASISPGIFAATVPAIYDAVLRKDYLTFRLGGFPAATGVSALRGEYEDPLWMLLGLSGLVLLIACANLANLMLARASARQREMALRLTLGASRARLIRQLLAESLLLAGVGTAAGVGLAQVLSRVLLAFLSTRQNPIFVELSPDWRLLGFAAGLAILTCLLFGLAPAVQASGTDPGAALKASTRASSAGRERFVLRRALVVSQVALSLVLLTGAILFVRTFHNLANLNAGFQQDHILVVNMDFSALHMPGPSRLAYRKELLQRMQSIPGVAAAAYVAFAPLSGITWNNVIDIPNGGPQRGGTNYDLISAGYFQTMQTPLLAGRTFNDMDTLKSPRVTIVNETFARKYFGGANPVGKIFYDSGKPDKTYQVVGLVKDTKYLELREEFKPIVFLAMTQDKDPDPNATIMVRSDEPLLPLISSIKRTAAGINPGMVLNFTVLKTQIREGLMRERLMATLSGFFGALAAILAMVGLYGVISYMVIRRRNEIGVRMALGANRSNILMMILREASMLLAVGLVVGVVLALAAGSAARSMLYGLKANDPLSLVASVAGMAVIALVASLVPAQRATTVHPMAALREE